MLLAVLVAATALYAAADRKTGGKKPTTKAPATATTPAGKTKAKPSAGKNNLKKSQSTSSHADKPADKRDHSAASTESDYASQLARQEANREAERKRVLTQLLSNMVTVQGGTFTMGATSEQGSQAEGDERPMHSVTLSSFKIGRYEVTQREWRAVTGSNPSIYTGDDLPVHYVSWNDCQVFIAQLNRLTGHRFRLPTEAEWEFAARGGIKSRHTVYAGASSANQVAWTEGNSLSKPHPVGTLAANELGLHDMSGNAWEWCADWYANYSRNGAALTDPTGPSSGSERIFRGGGWNFEVRGARVSYRMHAVPYGRFDFIGLRLAMDYLGETQGNITLPTDKPASVGTLTVYSAATSIKSGELTSISYNRGDYITDSLDPLSLFESQDNTTYTFTYVDDENVYFPTIAKSKILAKQYEMSPLPVSLIGNKADFKAADGSTARIFRSSNNGHVFRDENGQKYPDFVNQRMDGGYVLSVQSVIRWGDGNEHSFLFEEPLEMIDGNLQLYMVPKYSENASEECRLKHSVVGLVTETWRAVEPWSSNKSSYDSSGHLLTDQIKASSGLITDDFSEFSPFCCIAYIAALDALYIDGKLYNRVKGSTLQ